MQKSVTMNDSKTMRRIHNDAIDSQIFKLRNRMQLTLPQDQLSDQ